MNLSTVSAVSSTLARQLESLTEGAASCYSVSPSSSFGRFICEVGPQVHQEPVSLPALAKWLRVNDRPLERPDHSQVIDDLPDFEQKWLDGIDVRLCVPLVLDGDLLGMVIIHGMPGIRIASGRLADVAHQWSRGAAIALRDAIAERDSQLRTAAAYRSQQLSITGHLAASVAHEVRNPLAAVRSIVQLVRDTMPTPERQARMLGDVLVEVDRVDDSVSGLLGLAKPHEIFSSVSSLGDLAGAAVRFVEPLAHRNGIRISFESAEPLLVRIDSREFRQVMLNVILNACEACGPGDSIAVRVCGQAADSRNRQAQVQVRDTGPGIPDAVLERIFEPFFTTKTAGSGLGLGVCRDILRRNDASIRIEKAQPGTLVTIELPAVSSS